MGASSKSRLHFAVAGLSLKLQHVSFLEDAFNYTKHLLAGALSAVVSRTFCAPLETVKMQMIFNQRTGSTLEVGAGILREEGILGFWRGNGVELLACSGMKQSDYCP